MPFLSLRKMCIRDRGIRLYEPIAIGGVTFDELKFDASTFKLEIVNSSDVIQGTVPEGFRRYEEYEGERITNNPEECAVTKS